MNLKPILIITGVLALGLLAAAQENKSDSIEFRKIANLSWEEVFFDSCTENWQKQWSLDGEKANITHTKNGMEFWAGPVKREDASHAVLWTQESFSGDVKLEYEYTRLDDVIEAVTIIYILASGKDTDGFDKDISLWKEKRNVPAMNLYFNNMNTYHISYAAFNLGNTEKGNDYIRARRYMPNENSGLKNTGLVPDYFTTAMFEPGVKHNITILKKGSDLFMHIKNNSTEKICHWQTGDFPDIKEGRIGLRHMWTRGAAYKNFRISTLKN